MPKLIPVIHVENEEQAILNAKIASESGAYGCFLINHSISIDRLLECYEAVRKELPDYWIGLNVLGVDLWEWASLVPNGLNGIWIDNLGIDEERSQFDQPESEKNWIARSCIQREDQPYIQLFGGVAFKYQKSVKDPMKAAYAAQYYCDVVTTSGEGTGSAPSVEKIQSMSEALMGEAPLAIASGMTLENVSDFIPWVEYLLVATGISRSFTMLDHEKVEKMANLVQRDNNA